MQSALKVGQRIEYTIQGNPAQLTAILSRVSPIADPVSRQIEFFARPNETINSLSIGAFVEGNILASAQVSGQLIPLDVIQNIKDKPYVWVIRQNKIEKVPVVILNSAIGTIWLSYKDYKTLTRLAVSNLMTRTFIKRSSSINNKKISTGLFLCGLPELVLNILFSPS